MKYDWLKALLVGGGLALLPLPGGASNAMNLPDFSPLVEKLSPAVVNISTKQKRLVSRLPHGLQMPDIPEDSPLGELFKRFLGEGGGVPDDLDARSLGSGFLISRDGYILTNFHVVQGADEIIVRTSDRNEVLAKVIGGDKRSDVALIKIDADNLPVVEIGRPAELKVGEWVLAIGSPFGFDHSVTAGIVSAKGRNLPTENYVPFIQTDVAINPGNSGGPLFDLDGKVVGVNSQILSRTGGFMGLSFAIPIDVAMNVAEQLRTKGKVSRGWLGVIIQDVTRELAESFDVPKSRGALVAKVLPDSPAATADLQVGDVILSFNGKDLANSAALPPLVGSSPVDKPADLVVLRGGKEVNVSVGIAELPTEDELETATGKAQGVGSNRLGLRVIPLTEEQRAELNIDRPAGVLVETVAAGPAQLAGIEQGDAILQINNQWVDNVEHFQQIVEKLSPGRAVAVLVQREAGPLFLALRIPKE
jgi:serine protease Do